MQVTGTSLAISQGMNIDMETFSRPQTSYSSSMLALLMMKPTLWKAATRLRVCPNKSIP